MKRLVAVLFLLLPAIAHAEPVVTLPLDGYYRPGKFFPVKVESDRDVTVEVTADAVSSRGRGRSMVLPAMSLSRVPGVVKVTVDGKVTELSIRPLEAGQKLTAFLGTAGKTEGPHVVLPNEPLGQLSQAYESVDVVVSPDAGTGAAARLMACGVAVLSDPSATGTWPRGPTTSLDDSRPYNVPFVPRRDFVDRAGVFLMAAMFAIVVTAISLWRSRHAWKVVGLLSMAALAYGGYEWHNRRPITERSAMVRFRDGLVFEDTWTVAASLEDTQATFHAGGALMTRPVFAGQSEKLAMVIDHTPEGAFYRYHLPRNGRIAFVSRVQHGGMSDVPLPPEKAGIFRDLVQSYYVLPGQVLNPAPMRGPRGIEVYWVTPK